MLSVVIITLNEEPNIVRCLDSLRGLADEIIVVDSGSTDRTLSICQDRGVRLFQTKWKGYAGTKNFGNSQARGSYILSIDADEALSEELRNSLLQLKEEGFSGAYSFSRKTFYCGKWIRFCNWYPDRKVRLFTNGEGEWEGAFIHEKILLGKAESTTWLKGDLLHYSYRTTSEHRARIEHYSTLQALQIKASGKRISFLALCLKPLFKFIRVYLIHLGFLDGLQGLAISYYSAFSVYLKCKKAHG